MGQTWRRLMGNVGVWGWLGLGFLALGFWVIVVERTPLQVNSSGSLLRISGLVLGGLLLSALKWGTYTPSVETTPYARVLPGLLASREEFCLLLRPFGSDGEVTLTYEPLMGKIPKWRFTMVGSITPTLTMEQVIAAAARGALGVHAYAMVDADLLLAPPGPVYLRAPYSEWKSPAGDLIRRAHTIVVILPPGQTLRASMQWEVGEIVRRQRQSRVVVVLPPVHKREYDHPLARRQAGVLLAALTGSSSRLVDGPAAESLLQQHVPEKALVIKLGAGGEVRAWSVDGGGRRGRVGARAYVDAIREAIDANEQEWRGWGFRARYGVRAR